MTYQYDDPDYEITDAIRRGDLADPGADRSMLEGEIADRMRYYGIDARDALEDELRTGRWS